MVAVSARLVYAFGIENTGAKFIKFMIACIVRAEKSAHKKEPRFPGGSSFFFKMSGDVGGKLRNDNFLFLPVVAVAAGKVLDQIAGF